MRGKTSQGKSATHLLTNGGKHFHFTPGVLMRLPVLDVDHTHNFVSGNYRDRQKCLETIFRKITDLLETMILISLAGNRNQTALPSNPTGQTFVHLKAHSSDLMGMRVV